MYIKLDIASEIEDDFESFINTFEHPIIVTDGDLKIISKNNATKYYTAGAEIGKTIRGCFSDEEEIRIRDLKIGETLCCELKYRSAVYGANVFGLADRRMIVVNPVSSRLCESIRTLYERMSGYDMKIPGDSLFGEGLARRIRSKSASALLTDLLQNNLSKQKTAFFDIAQTVADFAEALDSIGIPVSVNNCSFGEEKTVVAGFEDEFMLLLAVAVFLNGFGDNGIVFEIERDGKRVYCRITGDVPSDIADMEFGTRIDASKRFEGELGEKRFWSYLGHLIANANLWDVSFEKTGEKTVFTISSELTSPYTGCIFRDEKNTMAKHIAEMFFLDSCEAFSFV